MVEQSTPDAGADVLELEVKNTSDRAQRFEALRPKRERALAEIRRLVAELNDLTTAAERTRERLAGAALRGAVAGFALGFALAWALLR